MKPPIFIENNGDITVFASLQAAENWVEPIDVRNNEYEAFDSEGRRLRLEVQKREGFLKVGHEYVQVTEVESEPAHAADLRERLQTFLKAVGEPDVDPAASLSHLVKATSRFATR